ncbi:hypothetical protein ES705_43837 [subsurface metagenome]
MIILGGWIEAIHIAIDVALESKEVDIIERLVDQKYSLNNLMIMLSDHNDSEVVQDYMIDLAKIKKAFDKIDIAFGVDFDPGTREGRKSIDQAIEQIENFSSNINDFRKNLIN